MDRRRDGSESGREMPPVVESGCIMEGVVAWYGKLEAEHTKRLSPIPTRPSSRTILRNTGRRTFRNG